MSVEATPLTEDTAADAFQSLLAAEKGENQADEKETAAVEGDEPEEGEETDAEPEAEESEDEEKPEEDEEKPQTFTVKLDGKEVSVPLDELLRGYQRTNDYTRKTQQVADQRKAVEGELETAKAERAHYAQQLAYVQSLMQQQAPQEPDWDALLQQNPHEYLRQERLHQQRQAQLAQLHAERQQLTERQQAEEARQLHERVESEKTKLYESIPEWKNTKTEKAEKAALVEFAVGQGYKPDDLSQITDHKVVVLLRKAMKYDEIIAQKANLRPVPQSGPRTAQPGNGAQPKAGDVKRAQQRLAQSGDIRDAASLMEQFL